MARVTDWEAPAHDQPDDQPRDRQGPSRPDKKGGRVVVLLILALVVLFGGGYAAAAMVAGDKVPRGTTVAGVDIGGRTPDAAVEALRRGLADLVVRPITVTVEGEESSVAPTEAGLSVDYEASVAAAGGEQGWSPSRLWGYYTGGDALDAVVEVDDAAMTATLDDLTESGGTPPRDAGVVFAGTRIRTTPAAAGRAIDPEAGREALVAAYLADDPATDLPLVDMPADVTDAEAQQFVDEFANPAVSAPVTLRFGKSPVTLRPADYTAALQVVARDGVLAARVDKDALAALVGEKVSDDGAPVDATVALVDGRPHVVPAKPGVTFKPGQVASAFLAAVDEPPGERTATVESTVSEPEFTTKDARALRIREKVSSFTTYYPYAAYRNVNIPRAAELVNGTVLRPGDVFSLNDVVGERTRENGFTEGFIISNGIFKEDLGGGVSQMATTTFNAMFFAGLKDVEHKPHSFYIDRYPVGREATVAWGAVDLRFQNDTPYGVLVEARVTPATPTASGVVTVSMWSTKYWDITTKTGERYNLTSPATRTLTTADCYPNTGYGGFDIDIWRYFRRHGSSELVRAEKMHTHYIPSDTVICKPPPG
jgi:vancomycin resistance protein YoaR